MTIEEWLDDELSKVERELKVSAMVPASYGYGYDRGYYDGLQAVFSRLSADEARRPVALAPPERGE